VAAAHVGCCVLWLCGCVVARVLYPFCRVDHPTHGNIFPLFNARTNAKLLTPSSADESAYNLDSSAHIKIGVAVRLGLRFEGGKYAFLRTSVRYLGRIGS